MGHRNLFMWARIVFVLVLCFWNDIQLSARDYYVSTTGNDNNAGTITSPFATWGKAFSVVNAGDIVYIRGGEYFPTRTMQTVGSNRNGTANNPIRIFNYPGEKPILNGERIVLDGWSWGIGLDHCSYWHIKGLEIKNFNTAPYPNISRGMDIRYCSNITIENCAVHHIVGDGICMFNMLEGTSTIRNCDSYYNIDVNYGGETANGVYMSGSQTSNLVIIGTRTWNCSDDGFDFFYAEGVVTLDSCWAFGTGEGSSGDGNGFKFGAAYEPPLDISQRIVRNCIAANNKEIGFDQNEAHVRMEFYNNVAYGNLYGFLLNHWDLPVYVKNNISYKSGTNALNSYAIHDHNSWDSQVTVSDQDFESVDHTQLLRARKPDGSLPDIDFMRLKAGSDLIDAGIAVGLPYENTAPDIGPFEYKSGVVVPPNVAPVVSDIPNQTVAEGSTFPTINLNNYVSDADNSDAQIAWSFSGNNNLSVLINSTTKIATITSLISEWNGNETITFKATDPGGLFSSDQVNFSVTAVNDAPVVSDIPNQTIIEGSSFSSISLDGYASDVDHTDSQITWTYSGNNNLLVEINAATRVAIISSKNADWNGSETITFRATDAGGLFSSDQVTFQIKDINNPPIINNQELQINEEEYIAGIIGKVIAEPGDDGQQLTYLITAGNESGLFTIDEQTGDLSSSNQDLFSYSPREYNLTIKVEDNGDEPKSNSALVTVKLLGKQNTVYIDPDNLQDLSQNGTIEHPYNSWSKVTWKAGKSYLQKKGTISVESKITITASDVSIGSYGQGEQPIIKSNATDFAIQSFEKNNISFNDIYIIAKEATSCIYMLGITESGKIERCTFEGADNGARIVDAKSITLCYSTFINCSEAIYSVAENNKLYYNVFKNNQTAINVSSYLSSTELYNNVFYDNLVGLAASYSNLTIFNNIFFLEKDGDIAFKVNGDKLNSDNNIFYPEKDDFISVGDNKYSTLVDYQQIIGLDLNSYNSDPRFIDVYSNNFDVDMYSPAINKGRSVDLQEDFYGKQVPYGIATDIGLSESRINPVDPVTSINSKNNSTGDKTSFEVFPNPSDGRININLTGINQGSSTLSIVDIAGKKIYEENYYPTNSEFIQHIDLSDMLYGIYFVILRMEDKIYNQRIVIN